MVIVARGVSGLLNELKDGVKGLAPLFILIVMTLVGALFFMELEAPNEQYMLETLQKDRQDQLDKTIYKLNNVRAMKPRQAYNHTKKTLLEFQEFLGIEEIDIQSQTKWTFWGAMFYCLTVYTTIGYGNIYPSTTAGRIATILYAFICIPLALISLYSLGLLFARLCRAIWHRMVKLTGVVSKDLEKKVTEAVGLDEESAKKSSDDSNEDDDELLSFPISFIVLLTILWILICAGIFLIFEDWDYGTSLYYTLISFLTIGFGDVVPSDYEYVVIVALLLLIGLSLVSTMLTLIQQQIQALASGMQKNIDREYMNALAEAADEGEITEEEAKQIAEGDTEAQTPTEQAQQKEKMDAILARMPMKSRLLYRAMPAASKKQLAKNAEQKANRRTRGCQTDALLLEDLIKEELLKLELNRDGYRPRTSRDGDDSQPAPRLVSRGFKIEKVTPVELVSNEDERPVISTTIVQEDEV